MSDDIEEQIGMLRDEGVDGTILEMMSKAARFHGHICPGLAIGVSASMIFLGSRERSSDEEIVAIVENDACGVDGIQSLLGCTFGKGNLKFLDHGKSVYTFFDRKTGKGKRYSFRGIPQREDDPVAMELFSKIKEDIASPWERKQFRRMWVRRAAAVLMEGEGLFDIKDTVEGIPDKANIYGSFICPDCGEKVGDHRAVIVDGENYCTPCSRRRTSE